MELITRLSGSRYETFSPHFLDHFPPRCPTGRICYSHVLVHISRCKIAFVLKFCSYVVLMSTTYRQSMGRIRPRDSEIWAFEKRPANTLFPTKNSWWENERFSSTSRSKISKLERASELRVWWFVVPILYFSHAALQRWGSFALREFSPGSWRKSTKMH